MHVIHIPVSIIKGFPWDQPFGFWLFFTLAWDKAQPFISCVNECHSHTCLSFSPARQELRANTCPIYTPASEPSTNQVQVCESYLLGQIKCASSSRPKSKPLHSRRYTDITSLSPSYIKTETHLTREESLDCGFYFCCLWGTTWPRRLSK